MWGDNKVAECEESNNVHCNSVPSSTMWGEFVTKHDHFRGLLDSSNKVCNVQFSSKNTMVW